MPRKSDTTTPPDWASKINQLREQLGLDRHGFAARFGVSDVTVSNWLTGKKHPKPSIYFRMAQLTNTPEEAAPFLSLGVGRSGMDTPGMHKMFELSKKPVRSAKRSDFGFVGGNATSIRLLKDPAAAGTPRQVNEKEIEEFLPFPKSLCPNPDHIVCIRVEGDSMSPILEAGYIVAVDTADRDRARLYGQMVLARNAEGEVTIKWFRKVGRESMLVPQHTSKRHPVLLLGREGDEQEDGGWMIVGKILWWIGMPT